MVDNGSRDFSDDELARHRGGQRVVSPTNLGFAGGANLGMRAALAAAPTGCGSSTTTPRRSRARSATLLAAAARPPYPQLLGAKIVQADQPDRLDSVAARRRPRAAGAMRLLGHDEVDRGQYDHLREPLAVTGCALLVSRRACERLGGFDESYFAYLEDADLCLRARPPAARRRRAARRACGTTALRRPRGRQSPPSLYYSTRNHLVVLALFCPRAPWLTRLRTLRVLGRYLAFAALRSGVHAGAAALRAVRRGVADYQRGIMGAAPPDGQRTVLPQPSPGTTTGSSSSMALAPRVRRRFDAGVRARPPAYHQAATWMVEIVPAS